MEALKTMFPSYEAETIMIVLEAHNGDIEATVEALLEMSGAPGESAAGEMAPGHPSRAATSAAASSAAVSGTSFREAQVEADALVARQLQEDIINQVYAETGVRPSLPRPGDDDRYNPYGEAPSVSDLVQSAGAAASHLWTGFGRALDTALDTAAEWLAPPEEEGTEVASEGEDAERRRRQRDFVIASEDADCEVQVSERNQIVQSTGQMQRQSQLTHRRPRPQSKKDD